MHSLSAFALVFLLCQVTFLNQGSAQTGPAGHPAADYCRFMGFRYEVTRDRTGSEQGRCILPGGRDVDAWDFLRGKAGSDQSYCSRLGYRVETVRSEEPGFITERPVCVKRVDGENPERIDLFDLMIQQGDWPVFQRNRRKQGMSVSMPPEGDLPADTLPLSLDLRNRNGHNYITAVHDQTHFCSSCYTFATCAAAEGEYNLARDLYDGNAVRFSESFLLWCLGQIPPYNEHMHGCDGSDFTYTELQATVDSGLCFYDAFPYDTAKPASCTHWNDPRVKMAGYHWINCKDSTGIKSALFRHGAVYTTVYSNTKDFTFYTGGVFHSEDTHCDTVPCNLADNDHSVALIGYGHDPKFGLYWILRNSMGDNWGEQGYMRIQWESARVACGPAYFTYGFPAGVKDPPELPGKMVLKPNPAGDVVTVVTDAGCQEAGKLEIVDLTGRMIQFCPVTGNETILSLAGLERGIYWVRNTSECGSTVAKLIKR